MNSPSVMSMMTSIGYFEGPVGVHQVPPELAKIPYGERIGGSLPTLTCSRIKRYLQRKGTSASTPSALDRFPPRSMDPISLDPTPLLEFLSQQSIFILFKQTKGGLSTYRFPGDLAGLFGWDLPLTPSLDRTTIQTSEGTASIPGPGSCWTVASIPSRNHHQGLRSGSGKRSDSSPWVFYLYWVLRPKPPRRQWV